MKVHSIQTHFKGIPSIEQSRFEAMVTSYISPYFKANNQALKDPIFEVPTRIGFILGASRLSSQDLLLGYR